MEKCPCDHVWHVRSGSCPRNLNPAQTAPSSRSSQSPPAIPMESELQRAVLQQPSMCCDMAHLQGGLCS